MKEEKFSVLISIDGMKKFSLKDFIERKKSKKLRKDLIRAKSI